MSDITEDIQGIDQVLDALDALPRALSKKVLYQANLDIVREIVRDPLKAALPHSTRTKRGVGIRKARGTENGAWAGIMSTSFFLRFIERGTKSRTTKKGWNRGIITSKPFIESFITSKDQEVLEATTQRYDSFVVKSLEKNLDRVNTKIKKL